MIRRPSRRARRAQWVLLAVVLAVFVLLVHNAAGNLAARHMRFSYDYLGAPANFDIPFHILDWATTDSYGRVLLVALANTLLVSALAIVTATLLGFLVGVMRLSVNWLLRIFATGFIELVRNTPQLIQVVFWYVAVLQALPSPRQSLNVLPGVLLNVRGLYIPHPVLSNAAPQLLAISALTFMAGIVAIRRYKARYWFWLPFCACVPISFAVARIDWPVVGGFNVRGGTVVPPELVALWLGLSIYSAGFIAEIVRSAIEAVPTGQVEAAQALGLRPHRILVSVILPQAIRMMVPPLTSQYLNLVKSSSLGAAIAYPEIFQIFAGTVLNQSGHEIETMSLVAAVFLTISLLISAFMNWYNRRMRLAGR
jgi:general L-amino acid transport system permease protein